MSIRAHLMMMRLASPALPIGGFSYSQGLESAIEQGWVHDEASLVDWLRGCLTLAVGRYEAPLAYRLFSAVAERDLEAMELWHHDYLASRETAELLAETLQMGFSLLKLLAGLQGVASWPRDQARLRLNTAEPTALPLAWGLAANALALAPPDALSAWAWSWLENQIAAAIKAVPLGQQCGQRVTDQLLPTLVEALEAAPTLPEEDWSNFTPGLAIASSWHESQYSRLFRS